MADPRRDLGERGVALVERCQPALVRINLDHPEVPAELGDRALGIATTGAALLRALVEGG